MNTLKAIRNEVTGEIQLQGSAKLITPLSEKTMENSNGKEYKLCTVEINGKKGTAQVYAGNYNHKDADFKVGDDYLVTVSQGDERGPLAQLSHLTAIGGRFESDAFDFNVEVEEQASVEEEVA